MKLYDAVLYLKKLQGQLMEFKNERIEISKTSNNLDKINSKIFSLTHRVAIIDGQIRNKNSQISSILGNFSSSLVMVAFLKDEIASVESIIKKSKIGECVADKDLLEKYVASLRSMLRSLMGEIKDVNQNNDIEIDIGGESNREF